jgi:signal transduction histidine kinase
MITATATELSSQTGFTTPPVAPAGLARLSPADPAGQTGPVPPLSRRGGFLRRAAQYLAYSAYCAVVPMVFFTVLVTLLSAGFGLVIVWVGIPLLMAAFVVARAHADSHRGFLRWLGDDIPKLPPRPARRGLWGAFRDLMGSAERWREVLLGTVGAVLLCVLGSVGLGCLGFGVMELASTVVPGVEGLVTSGGTSLGVPGPGATLHPFLWWADALIGAAALLVSPAVAWGAGKACAAVVSACLKPSRAAMERRIATLSEARTATEEAEAASLRQIERDLHDGPQQRLIRTGMDLSAVQRRLAAGDVAAAQELLAEAQTRTNETIQEIRQLARGFAPPILADKGLVTALASLAGAAPVPARFQPAIAAGERFSEPVERALYFTAAEAIANAAKHAGASRIDLSLGRLVGADGTLRLVLTVRDDGRGGAIALPGHGLDGLRARLAGVEGTLAVESPAGRGTAVTAAVPVRT